ncbi:MAG: A/G-specific adenine glycosylase [Burkholderiales bacterium]|nr:A/G-specific adenine glycosylase [Burkholderiales bacterium]
MDRATGPAADPAGQAAAGLAAEVQRWQRRHGRHDLPWVGERDPYRVWLSEVMLQQTQVASVLDYYRRFLVRFPDVRSLAAAAQADVLAMWSGLGYYSRARHLHRCAIQVVAEFDGTFPADSAALARLPGIGRSTAAAIAAFCFGERAAILDGNVKRVLTRVLGFGADLADAAAERELWATAQALLPRRGIESYTQGLMDLGATVCLARQPLCESCPLERRCVARAQGRPQHYPVKTRRLRRGRRDNAVLWLEHRGRWWLVQRPQSGVWAGLWCLPLLDDDEALAACTQGWPGAGAPLPPLAHALTHFDWTLRPVLWRWPARRKAPAQDELRALGEGRWFSPGEALATGLPAPVRRLFEAATEPG